MKISELARYCEEIDTDCSTCEHEEECKELTERLDEISPYGLVDMIKKDEELS